MQLLKQQKKDLRHLILYGIIGCCSSGLDFCVFSLLNHLGLFHYVISNSLSVLVGIITSFTLNRYYNFKVKDKTIKRFSIFLTIGLLGMLLSNLILAFCFEMLELNSLLSKLLSIGLVVVFQFFANKHITFKNSLK